MVIEDFDGVIYQWLKYKGERWKRCSECGKWVKTNSNNFKRCKQCAKLKKLEQTNECKKRSHLEES